MIIPYSRVVLISAPLILATILTPASAIAEAETRAEVKANQESSVSENNGPAMDANTAVAINIFDLTMKAEFNTFMKMQEVTHSEFRESIVHKKRQEKLTSLKTFFGMEYAQEAVFREAMHKKQLAFLEGLPPSFKEKLIREKIAQYENMKVLLADKHAKRVAFLDKDGSDPTKDSQALFEASTNFSMSQLAVSPEHSKNQSGLFTPSNSGSIWQVILNRIMTGLNILSHNFQ
ncbi:MAG: hypothetical protein HQM09_20640 [Candidatus Riflebacteria bacterium]|nr:hypothetical protein [Candidatus Riflebacteria bacterium]